MTQPVPYTRGYSFTDFSSGSPTSQPPGVKLDAEYDAISDTLAEILANLAKIQRDDTRLANTTVGIEQLSSAVLALVGQEAFSVRGQWLTATSYLRGDFYSDANQVFIVMADHTSTTIAADTAAGKAVGPVFYPDTAQVAAFTASLAASTGAGLIGTATGATLAARLAALATFLTNIATPGAPNGGSMVAVDDSAGGVTFTNIQGFVTRLLSSSGASSVGFLQTGAGAVARTVQSVLRDKFSVKDFGAVGSGSVDDRAAIQAAEDAAATLAGITGSGVGLYFPDGNFAVGAAIQKKTGVHWDGPGRIEHLNYATATTTYSLVTANAVNDWSIEGLSFRNVTRTRELAAAIPIVVGIGTLNSCIDIYGCSRFSVRHNTFRQFTFGVVYRGCSDGYINDNWLYADSGKTAEQIDDNTYTHFSTFIAGSGGIVITYEGGGTPSAVSRNIKICGNHVEVAGLDVGIEALSQTYDAQRVLVQGNTVRGCTTGIQGYRGSMADPGTAPTYNSGLVIALNRVYLSWGAGVYMRGLVGGQVFGNTFERCGKIGMDGASSAGSMVFRVNPFTAGGTFGAPASPVSNDHAMLVFGNRVIDHGREDVACDPAVLIEYDGVKFTNNEVQRSDERFNTARGAAIYLGNGKAIKNVVVNDNTITGRWTYGIFLTDILRATSVSTHWAEIKRNTLNGEFTAGIETNWNAFSVDIDDNILHGTFTDGIKLRFSPLSKITRNKLRGTFTNGILLAGGSLLSDVPYITSGGTITRANRRGGSTIVEDNDVWGATTPYAVSETTGSDALFWSRCASYERNRIRGQLDLLEFGTGGTPGLTNAPRVWLKHETTRNSGLAVGQPLGKICLTPGQGGSTTTATGTTAVGSPIITAVSSLDGWAPGIFLTMAEFTGVRRIIAIDTAAATITVDANATAAVAGAVITPATPTFASLPNAA